MHVPDSTIRHASDIDPLSIWQNTQARMRVRFRRRQCRQTLTYRSRSGAIETARHAASVASATAGGKISACRGGFPRIEIVTHQIELLARQFERALAQQQ